MKYIITESKLDKVIFRYLDKQDFNVKEGKNSFYLTNSPSSNDVIIIYNKDSGLCAINYSIISPISGLFSLIELEAQELIGEWFENKFKVNVTKTSAFDDMGFLIVKKTH